MFFKTSKKTILIFLSACISVSTAVYALLYTTLPVHLISFYFNHIKNISLDIKNQSGYILHQNGINIESVEIDGYVKAKLSNINIKISSNNLINNKKLNSLNKDNLIDFGINNITITYNNNNYHVNNITGKVGINNLEVYQNSDLIIWRDNKASEKTSITAPKLKNHLKININKIIHLDDSLPDLLNFNISADFNRSLINWNIIADLQTKYKNNPDKPKLYIEGSSKLSSFIPQSLHLKANTKRPIYLVDNKEAIIIATPVINISLTESKNTHSTNNKYSLNIFGNIDIESGQITPFNQSKLTPSSDVEIINTNKQKAEHIAQESSNLSNINIETTIKLISNKSNLVFKTKELKTNLQGELNLHYIYNSNKTSVPLAEGEINLINGRYNIYSYPLKITQGSLLYSNNPINNPNIKLIGERVIEIKKIDRSQLITNDPAGNNEVIPETKMATNTQAKIGINISGTLNKPEIKLYSSEPMQEADKMSYLLFGEPSYKLNDTDGLNEAHGKILLQTAKQLFGNSDEYTTISNQINDIITIDDFDIINKKVTNPETGHVENQATLVVSKRFFDRLLIKYGFNIVDPLSTFSAEYKIRDNLSVTARYDGNNNSSADLVYSKETDHLF